MSKRRIGSLLFTVFLLAVIILAAMNAQRIRDLISYYQYEPAATIASFAADTGMSEEGRFIFYASHPMLLEAQPFNQQCKKQEKSTAILGCYDGEKIYLYDITDPQLTGIRPATAAHEMLHAAYSRLGSEEKKRLGTLLEAEYSKLQNNKELADRLAFYERTQPGEHENELHSIIGTEVSTISNDLEEYYRRYFSDRTKVIAQHNQYHSLFEELRTRAETLSARIDQLAVDIKNQTAAYEGESRQLQGAIAAFNARAQRGDFESQAAFARERQALVARADTLEGSRGRINATVEEYNALVAELNGIAIQTDTLNRNMDSQLAPVPSL